MPSKKKKVKESVSFTAVVFGFELPCDSLKEIVALMDSFSKWRRIYFRIQSNKVC